MTDIVTAYLRQPLQSLAKAEATRLDTVGEMFENLRRLAWKRFGCPANRPIVSARIGTYGWTVAVYDTRGLDGLEFEADTLSEAHAKAMAWATDTKAERV